jgi:tRNA threonylcarbamoyl adenosine modification protein YeaZ
MILAFDTSSAACTAALFDDGGRLLAQRDEIIGRGHAERLVPMIAELMEGRAASKILVGVGPGSFTGIRVAIAAAHGLAIGWNAVLLGMDSLALLVAGANLDGVITAAISGGHGELFVQSFDSRTLHPASELRNAAPAEAAALSSAEVVVGSGAKPLVDARGWGSMRDLVPSAANALKLPEALRTLSPKPVYARAPDARVPEIA